MRVNALSVQHLETRRLQLLFGSQEHRPHFCKDWMINSIHVSKKDCLIARDSQQGKQMKLNGKWLRRANQIVENGVNNLDSLAHKTAGLEFAATETIDRLQAWAEQAESMRRKCAVDDEPFYANQAANYRDLESLLVDALS